MKLSEVIRHTQKILPMFTDKFSSVLSVSSLSAVNNLVTVVTDENHNLTSGELITVKGAMIPTPVASLTQLNGIGTMITTVDHDLTKNTPLRKGDSTYITIAGANEEAFNGTFLILDIPNANVVEFVIDEDAPLVASGDIILKENSVANFNGRRIVKTVLTPKSFTFELPYIPTSSSAVGDISISTGNRISGAFSLEHAVSAYSELNAGQLSGYVVLDGADVSKSKVNQTDAVATSAKGSDLRLDLVQGISFYVFLPTQGDYCWVDQVDLVNSEIRTAILKTLHNKDFSSEFADDTNYLSFVGDSPVDTDGTAYMIYAYKFQTTMYLQNTDGYDGEYSRALRHFEFFEKNNSENSEDTTEYISEGDLSDEHIN